LAYDSNDGVDSCGCVYYYSNNFLFMLTVSVWQKQVAEVVHSYMSKGTV